MGVALGDSTVEARDEGVDRFTGNTQSIPPAWERLGDSNVIAYYASKPKAKLHEKPDPRSFHQCPECSRWLEPERFTYAENFVEDAIMNAGEYGDARDCYTDADRPIADDPNSWPKVPCDQCQDNLTPSSGWLTSEDAEGKVTTAYTEKREWPTQRTPTTEAELEDRDAALLDMRRITLLK